MRRGLRAQARGALGVVGVVLSAGCGPAACVGDACYGPSFQFAERWPARVDTRQRFVAIAVGSQHACGLTESGAAWCWGNNAVGQLGGPAAYDCAEGTLRCSAMPLPVAGGPSFTRLTAGADRTCAVAAVGSSWCWGGGDYGQDNNGQVPIVVRGDHAFEQIVASRFSPLVCGLKADGSLWCWGDGFGSSGPTPSVEPSWWAAAAGVAARRIALGARHACALDTAGQAWCVGENWHGELGSDAGVESPVPAPVAGARVYTQIVAGDWHGCALDAGGQAWCWGSGDGVGDGLGLLAPARMQPVAVAGGLRFTRLSAGYQRTCGLTTDGQAWCWGLNAWGALGDGTLQDRRAPVAVLAPPLSDIATGVAVTCGIDASGAAWCWGDNASGAVGRPIVAH